ncbi:MAG: GspE/PulE family protein [Candidatus Paceibacterota bacterium]|jgi:type IV pilus assembly protein PilB
MSFLDQLADDGVIKKKEVHEIEAEALDKGVDIEDVLYERGVEEAKLLELKSKYLKVPSHVADPKKVTFDILKYIPEESASFYKLVPLEVEDGVLLVGLVDPDNIDARDALQFISSKIGMPFKVFLISKRNFKEILKNYQGLTGEVTQALGELDTGGEDINFDETPSEEKVDISKIVEDAPVTKIVAVIIRHANEGNASDIHIENTGEKVKVRFRVDGTLHTSLFLPMAVYSAVVARIKILANMKLDEKRKPQDGRFSVRMDGRKVDIRVSTFPSYNGEKVVMRILDSERGVKALDSLDLTARNLTAIRAAIARPYGIILISGPTGSGKTTTLYSMLNELDREKRNVVSLEDPIEYSVSGMSQSQIVPEIGYTFATGLRSILRQDPDIIMVGEIRDKETAQLAIQAALTGHLVLSTIHTNNAVGVIPRLIDMGVDPYLIAPTLVLSMAQRLVRVICPSSKKAVPIVDSFQMMVDKQFSDLPEEFKLPILEEIKKSGNLYEAEPSADCPAGTRGRVAVFEVLPMDKEVEALVLRSGSEIEIADLMRKKGMLTMKEDALLKCARGEVPFREVGAL